MLTGGQTKRSDKLPFRGGREASKQVLRASASPAQKVGLNESPAAACVALTWTRFVLLLNEAGISIHMCHLYVRYFTSYG